MGAFSDRAIGRHRDALPSKPLNGDAPLLLDRSPDEIAAALGGEVGPSGWINAPGPGHSARDRSLGVLIGPEHPEGFRVEPKAGEDWRECRAYVREMLGLTASDPNAGQCPAFIYKQADGTPHLKVVKKPGKVFLQQHWTGSGWERGAPPGPRIPYRLPELTRASDMAVIFITEGEKDADNVAALGLIATTAPMGAGKWAQELTPYFAGRAVRVLADNDAAGRNHATAVAKALNGVASDVRIVELPGLPAKGDVSDWIAQAPETNDGELLATLGDAAPPLRSEIIRAIPYVWRPGPSIPPRAWLYGRHYIRRFVTATMAPSGLGKSLLSLVEAVAMATGRDLLGVGFKGPPLRVWYWNGEDPLEEIERRLAAICLRYAIDADALGDRLHIGSGRDCPIIVATEFREGADLNDVALAELEATVRDRSIDVVIFDPFATVHSVAENDNNKIGRVMGALADLADRTSCGVELVHHVRKPFGGAAEVTADDGRGASAFKDRVRSGRVLNGMTVDEARKFSVEPARRRFYIRADVSKANLAPPEAAVWLELESIGLGNGNNDHPADNVAVATRWEPPDTSVQVTPAQLLAAFNTISAGEWRASDQTGRRWIGVPVAEALGLDLSEPGQLRRVKATLKLWRENGMLEDVERRLGDQRKEVKFTVVGRWPEPPRETF